MQAAACDGFGPLRQDRTVAPLQPAPWTVHRHNSPYLPTLRILTLSSPSIRRKKVSRPSPVLSDVIPNVQLRSVNHEFDPRLDSKSIQRLLANLMTIERID